MTNENQELVTATHRLALSESGFVFDPSSGQSFTVNPVGLVLLRELQKTGSLQETKDYALKHYSGDAQDISRETDDFFSSLSEQLGRV